MDKRNLSFGQLFNLSFGFFGVQIAYALQSANISRIFATLGADPHQLSFFWILPPLMGMIVQPLIGILSDKTWCKLGRRKPYLLIGAVIAVAVMALLPNAGSLGLTTQVVMWGLTGTMLFGLFSLMFLDTSINIAMQPFKMMVGDSVNEEQKGTAYAIQSWLCNAGSLVGYLFPYIFTYLGVKNIAPEGIIPDSVIYSFYIGAAILIICVLYTILSVKELNPQEYAEFHNLNAKVEDKSSAKDSNVKSILVPFLTVGLVQFFCWAAFMYMWTYSPGAIAFQCWNTTDVASEGYQAAGNWVGVVFAIQAVGSIAWASLLPLLEKWLGNKWAYAISLLVGAIGFVSIYFIHNQYMLFVSYALVGAAWAAMLALPFTIITNALSGSKYMGTFLGLFNCTICLPQIVAAATGKQVLTGVENALLKYNICASAQTGMLVLAGVLLVLGAISVIAINEKK